VVERANVGRSTLYAHFGGLDGVLKQALTGPSTRLAELADRRVAASDVASLLDHFKDQRKRNGVFFAPPIRGLWVRRVAELIEPRLEALARVEGRAAPLLPYGFIATQVGEQQIALVANWLSMRVTTPSDVIAAAMIAMTRATIDGLSPPGEP
jgi:AcrR family transcriptional regulator